ncbi:hypothetical protein BDW22DRAFT_1354428 [Trametopsis cervina]|nr:hypothetical protein BDW22DRAFT_1354428 [Trametopsis cervina]
MGTPPSSVRPSSSEGSQEGSSKKYSPSAPASSRQDHPRYRTKPCKHDLEGQFPRGDQCSYIHAPRPIMMVPGPFSPVYYSYASNTVLSPVLQDAVLQNPSYVMGTGWPSHDVVDAGTPVAPPSTPQLAAEVDAAFQSLSYRARHGRSNRGRPSRVCHYRTKPCSFYAGGKGHCVKGDRCNFRHDLSIPSVPTDVETESSVGADTSTASESDHEASVDNPHSPSTAKQDRRNYYPISWRVVSGGVMMSGPREICQDYMAGRCADGLDCKFSHPTSGDESEPTMLSEVLMSPFYTPSLSPAPPVGLFHVPMLLQPPPRSQAPWAMSDARDKRQVRSRGGLGQLYDGETLLPVINLVENADEAAQLQEVDATSEPREDVKLLSARSIPRPVSTPPATAISFVKIARIFPAESPC